MRFLYKKKIVLPIFGLILALVLSLVLSKYVFVQGSPLLNSKILQFLAKYIKKEEEWKVVELEPGIKAIKRGEEYIITEVSDIEKNMTVVEEGGKKKIIIGTKDFREKLLKDFKK